MNSGLDDLLESATLEPPADFAQQVMQRLDRLPEPRSARRSPRWLPWVAVVCGVILGAEQLAQFVFCAWIVTNAS